MSVAPHPVLEAQLREARGPDGHVDLERLIQLVSARYAAEEGAPAQQRAALAQIRVILEQIAEAVISADANGTVLSFNRAAERLLGWEADEVVGRHIRMLLNGEWNEERAAAWRDLVQAPESHLTLEREALTKSGQVLDVEISIGRVEADGVITLTGFWRDMTQRKAAADALVLARDEAEAANRAKSEFLAAMSHEIRTPLNGVLGMAAALETTPLTDLQRRMIGVINESGQTLMTLLSDILDLSKIEAGAMELEATPFDLAASIQAVAGLYEETARSKGLEFKVRVEDSVRGMFLGDPTRIRQVLQNLISNALKFTSEGSVELRVSATPTSNSRRDVVVEVTDTGCGISPEACGRLFSKFVQADSSTSRKYGGTGLGLAICRELVTAMEGEISVESEEGRGSRFWFMIPLPLAAEAEAPEAAQPAPEADQDQPLRILAAEDNPTNQFVLKAILGQKGLEPTFVENGRLAVEAVQQADFDIILMDLHMPEMDGISATQAIRALPGAKATIPIVAVTAEAMPEQIRKCMAAGMDGHVAKPIRPDVLYAVIEEVLTRTTSLRMTA